MVVYCTWEAILPALNTGQVVIVVGWVIQSFTFSHHRASERGPRRTRGVRVCTGPRGPCMLTQLRTPAPGAALINLTQQASVPRSPLRRSVCPRSPRL